MAPNEFIGRDKEAAALRKSYSSEKSKFVAVYGRKGVGKTSLVRNILGDRLDFEFTASCGITQRLQRRRFQNALDLKTGSRGKVPADWFAAFDRLKDYLPSLGRERAWFSSTGCPLWTRRKAFSSVPCHTSGTDGTVRVRSSSSMSADLTEHG